MVVARLLSGTVSIDTTENVKDIYDNGYGASAIKFDSTERFSLVLLDEEALYLAQNEIIVVKDEKDSTITICELWNTFRSKSSSFPHKYKVYTFFKQRNYFIKTGINFGMDYCLYQKPPSQCHSELCVMVVNSLSPKTICNTNSTITPQELFYRQSSKNYSLLSNPSDTTWRHLSTITRVMPDVMKICLICYIVPKDENNLIEESSAKSACSPYLSLFGRDQSKQTVIDITSIESLDQLDVRPVTSIFRRSQVSVDQYFTVRDLQKRYRQAAKLRHARSRIYIPTLQETTENLSINQPIMKKKSSRQKRKRRDPTEIRAKSRSKANVIWDALLVNEDESVGDD